jgi:putative FmdB family regulatory protein
VPQRLQSARISVWARYTGIAMPIYEYTCDNCKSPLSVFVRSMSSEVNPKCEKCGSTDLTRAISGFAVLGIGGSDSGFDGGDADMASMMQQMGGMGGGMGGMGGMDDFGGGF